VNVFLACLRGWEGISDTRGEVFASATIIGRALVGYGGWMACLGGQSHGVGAFQYEYEVKLHLSETRKSKFQASNIEYSFRTMI
jgi:hypothetical protein